MTRESTPAPDFHALDIRAGTVLAAEAFPEARKPSYRLTLDFGEIGIRRSSAQITDLYRPEDLIGMQVVAVVNLPPKRIAGFLSECLVLGVYGTDGKVVLLSPLEKVADGSKVG